MRTQEIKQTIANATKGMSLLGRCIFWTFSEQKITHDEFVALLKECDIDPVIAPLTRKKSAVVKAVESLVTSQKDKFKRKHTDDPDLLAYSVMSLQDSSAVMDETKDDAGVKFETRVFLNKKTNTVRVFGSDEMKKQVEALVADYEKSYTMDQIREAILRYVFKYCDGVMVREHGGLYFVPETHKGEFEKLKRLVELLNRNSTCTLGVIEIVDRPDTVSTIWTAVISEARGAMADMMKDIEELQHNPTARAQELRLDKYLDLKTKIQMYETLLNGTAKDLMKELGDVEAAFRARIASNASRVSK